MRGVSNRAAERRSESESDTTTDKNGVGRADESPAEVRLINLFLRPDEAEVLPFRVEFPDGDPFALDAERVRQGDRDTPIATAVAYLETNKFEEQLVPDLAWMSSLLSFITRSPIYADALITRGGEPGGRWERLRTNIGLPKYGRRRGSHMFRMRGDLRTFFDAAWPRLDEEGFEESGIPQAMEWHNFARGGHGLHYLDIQLAHHWIALEILAARWAKANERNKLLNAKLVSSARDCLDELADREGLDDKDRQALRDKAAELQRRPMKGIVLEYLRTLFEPYPAQPVEEELEALLTDTIKWRNTTVHDGSLVIHEMPNGVDRVVRGIRQLEGITARALLAELKAPLALLTEVPWTDWRQAA